MLIVNLFAGPGAGKSTMAARVFSDLKSHGVCAELALEFAKDLTWEWRDSALSCMPYVFGEQLWRLERLKDTGVETVITDGPLLLSTVYGKAWPRSFLRGIADIVSRQNRLNFLVLRAKPYDPRGRRQSEDRARELDDDVRQMLETHAEPYKIVPGDGSGAYTVTRAVLERLREQALRDVPLQRRQVPRSTPP
jgi:hypothetical protein